MYLVIYFQIHLFCHFCHRSQSVIYKFIQTSFVWNLNSALKFSVQSNESKCRLFLFLLGCHALHCVFYRGPASATAILMVLINNACIQHVRPCDSSSLLTHHWKSHSSQELQQSLWISLSSSSPMSSLGSRCTGWWTGRAISSTPPRTLRYCQPACTAGK